MKDVVRGSILGAFALTIGLLSAETPAVAETDAQREACTPDVFRLCAAYIPDRDRIAACLRGSGPRLSKPCYDVFFPPQDSQMQPPPMGQRRRYEIAPPPRSRPEDDDDDD